MPLPPSEPPPPCCWCGDDDPDYYYVDPYCELIDSPNGPGHPACLWAKHHFDRWMTDKYGPGWNRGYAGLEDWTPPIPDPDVHPPIPRHLPVDTQHPPRFATPWNTTTPTPTPDGTPDTPMTPTTHP